MTRPLLLFTLSLLILPTLHAQQVQQVQGPVAIKAPPPVPRGRVTGKVTCSDTRQPARGAMVMLEPMPSKEKHENNEPQSKPLAARVGMDGTFLIDHIAAGDYALIAFFPGYLSPFDGLVISEDTPDPEVEMRSRLGASNLVHIVRDTAQTADLVIERGATVSGRVLYSDGAPATQNNIVLEDVSAKSSVKSGEMSMDVGAMMRGMFTHQSVNTDDTGHFRISGLRPGTYRIAVTEPINMAGLLGDRGGEGAGAVMGMVGGIGDPHAMRFYAGDTVHRKSAKTYELRAGDSVDGLDIRIPIDGFHPVRVKLTAIDGRPLTAAALTLVDTADDALVFTAVNRHDGLFEFTEVPAGTYTLTTKSGLIGQQYGPTAAIFADGTAAVIVKDSDPAEVLLTLKELPLPKPDPNAPVPEE